MSKTTYTATSPSGEIVTRKTARSYSHAVFYYNAGTAWLAQYDKNIAEAEAYGDDKMRARQIDAREWYTEHRADRWLLAGFCGRADLAQKKAAEYSDCPVAIVEAVAPEGGASRWDAEAGCYLMDTAAGPRPHDPVIYHIPPTGDISVDVTKRTPSGPFDVTVIDADTGLSVGTRTFAAMQMALDYAHVCYRAEGGN